METRARAPGKIILSGEHAVVHGATAVAASIDLYTDVLIRSSTSSGTDDGLVELQLKDMGLVFSWPVQRIKETLPELGTALSPSFFLSESMKSIATLVEEQNIPEAKIGLFGGVSAFLFLYTSIQGFKPATVVITSDLPMGSGLGSSAAFCVALSAALLAYSGEKIIHGKPSGIDNTVSTFGNMIMFRLGELTRITSNMPLRMLITNTKVGRNTKALVAGVSERASRHPDAMAAVFSAVDSISKELSSIIQSPASDELSITENEEKLEELMEMNQGLLQSMGVSHSSIEAVLRTTLKYKLASKLTGAGGGGCVLTLLPALLADAVVDKVIAELESCGFQCLVTAIGGKGLEISSSCNSSTCHPSGEI
ncbi:hypothetical protein MRB53_031200 [Persea americana]|uniref:Uncharacterized protein n=1 Tax=Persea americana TaxID=3435 RepID=A0ACC2KP88_PERAE|nr:hypothetical protein MRB53_031200 [Persea americana]